MLDLFPVELREPVWYILSGFILGFAVSTLWEWLYFRRYRVETGGDEVGRFTRTNAETVSAASSPVLQKSPEFEPASAPGSYRSPTVFLNRERTQTTTVRPATQSESVRPVPAQEQGATNAQFATDVATDVATSVATDVDAERAEARATAWRNRQSAPPSSQLVTSASSGQSTAIMRQPEIMGTGEISSGEISSDETWATQPTQAGNLEQSPLAEERAASVVTETIASQLESDVDEQDFDPLPDDLSQEADASETDEAASFLAQSREWLEHRNNMTVLSEQNRGESRVPRSRGYPDDLTKIRGIGDVYKRRLFAANIFTFHHVATSDVEVLRRATQAAPNANIDSWPAQAEALAQKYQRTNASYSGPLPDDLQQIPGIGPYFAQTLYRSGICTFAQLADASMDELRALFPASILGREVDLEQWLAVAEVEAGKQQ